MRSGNSRGWEWLARPCGRSCGACFGGHAACCCCCLQALCWRKEHRHGAENLMFPPMTEGLLLPLLIAAAAVSAKGEHTKTTHGHAIYPRIHYSLSFSSQKRFAAVIPHTPQKHTRAIPSNLTPIPLIPHPVRSFGAFCDEAAWYVGPHKQQHDKSQSAKKIKTIDSGTVFNKQYACARPLVSHEEHTLPSRVLPAIASS